MSPCLTLSIIRYRSRVSSAIHLEAFRSPLTVDQHIYIYIKSSTDRSVSFYQNSSVWLDILASRSWDRNPVIYIIYIYYIYIYIIYIMVFAYFFSICNDFPFTHEVSFIGNMIILPEFHEGV